MKVMNSLSSDSPLLKVKKEVNAFDFFPNEVFHKIFLKLELRDLYALRLTNKRCYVIVSNVIYQKMIQSLRNLEKFLLNLVNEFIPSDVFLYLNGLISKVFQLIGYKKIQKDLIKLLELAIKTLSYHGRYFLKKFVEDQPFLFKKNLRLFQEDIDKSVQWIYKKEDEILRGGFNQQCFLRINAICITLQSQEILKIFPHLMRLIEKVPNPLFKLSLFTHLYRGIGDNDQGKFKNKISTDYKSILTEKFVDTLNTYFPNDATDVLSDLMQNESLSPQMDQDLANLKKRANGSSQEAEAARRLCLTYALEFYS